MDTTRGISRPPAPLLLIAALIAALCAPGAASAKTITAPNIKGPSFLRCYVKKYGSGIECSSSYLKDPNNPAPELDVYLALKNRGNAFFGQRGDYPGYPGTPKQIHHGDWWKPGRSAKQVKCQSRASGLWCKNADGHGFRMSKSVTALF